MYYFFNFLPTVFCAKLQTNGRIRKLFRLENRDGIGSLTLILCICACSYRTSSRRFYFLPDLVNPNHPGPCKSVNQGCESGSHFFTLTNPDPNIACFLPVV